jgi:CheY-like chemotaxis protein/nitrogen-specific signal transduction histidine kinase
MLESKSRELFKANLKLAEQSEIIEEKVLQRTAQLQKSLHENLSANNIKQQFITNISHELRTPLNGILGTLQLLLERPKDNEQKKLVGHALVSAERLKMLISDMIDMSRLERGELKLDEYEFNVGGMVRELADHFCNFATSKDLSVTLNGMARTDLQIVADPARLRQIMFSLIENALKFTDRGGVEISLGLHDIEPEKMTLYFSVVDTGVGIAPDKLGSIFDQFTQADDSPSRKHQGAGLGLATSSQLLKLMGAQLQVSNRPGGGSHFWFTLPLRHEMSLQERQTGGHIMLVAPYDGDRSFMVKDLSKADVNVTVCNDSQAMLRGLAEETCDVDLILLDERISKQDSKLLADSFPSMWRSRTALLCLSKQQSMQHTIENHYVSLFERPLETDRLSTLLAVFNEAGELWDAPCQSAASVTDVVLEHEESEELSVDFEASDQWRGKVLLVEDNRLNALIAIEMLKLLGIAHEWVENGREAIDALREQSFALVLMDCQMPMMDGYEATQRIRAGEAGESMALIPIIALTADNPSQGLHTFMKSDMNGWIAKPLEIGRIEVEMKRHLLRRTAAAEFSFDARLAKNPALAKALLEHWRELLKRMSLDYNSGVYDAGGKKVESAFAVLIEIAEAFELSATLGGIRRFLSIKGHDNLAPVFESTVTELQQHIKSKLHSLSEVRH